MQVVLMSSAGVMNKIFLPTQPKGIYRFTLDNRELDDIYIEAQNGKWFAVANAPLCVVGKGNLHGTQIELTNQRLLRTSDNQYVLYAEQTVISTYDRYYVDESMEISIGRSSDSDIAYSNVLVSGTHAILSRTRDGWHVADQNSLNGTYVNGQKIRATFLYDGDVVDILGLRIVIGSDDLKLNYGTKDIRVSTKRLRRFTEAEDHNTSGKNRGRRRRPGCANAELSPIMERNFQYSRAPRLMSEIKSEIINLEKPPTAGGTPQINWLTVLITPLVSVALMVVLVFALGMSAVMLIMSGVMSVVSAVMAIINYKSQKKKFRQTNETIHQKYHDYLTSIAEKISDAQNQQLEKLLKDNPSPRDCLQMVQARKKQLWERSPYDTDFMTVRLGLGTIRAATTAVFRQNEVVIEETELEKEAKCLANQTPSIANAPILCDLLGCKQTGVIGDRTCEIQVVRNIVTELTTLHAYNEVKIVALIPEKEKREWDWMRWLPHTMDNQREKRFIFTSMEEAEESLDEICETLGSRANSAENSYCSKQSEDGPYYVFILAAQWGFKHAIKKYILSDAEFGCSAIFVLDKMAFLPKECDQVIDVNFGNGVLYATEHSSEKQQFTLDKFSREEADSLARSMAPLYLSVDSGVAVIPTSVTFLEGYGVSSPEQLNIGERWKNAKTYKSLSVPIAAVAGGESFSFDIHEKKHGVNGIVAGMPGSGKTEMVQSWLLSLATNFSPQDISFILIDFKGTGLIAPFKKLPHVAGTISNLDANIDRNLIAIQSEVHRREALIDKYSDIGVKNINDLNKSFANGGVPERLPVLLIIIDEYAEFKKVFPDFGAEIDSLTSKGRALGMFVILMTQKPAGVVSAKSEDNIKFRWCMRVANYSASREMLGKPDAAKIKNSGRAYIKVGEDDVYEQVQAFWSGAPYVPGTQDEMKDFTPISGVALNGKRTAYEHREKKQEIKSTETEIDAVVRYISEYCQAHGIPEADKVWTEKLPERVALPDLLSEGFDGKVWPEKTGCAAIVGIMDDPANQSQYPFALDLTASGHTVIYGAPTTGKTTFLKTLTMSLAMTQKPDEVSIYILDFGGWNMNVLRDLPHVGGIANDNEPERISKLCLLLEDELQKRKLLFSGKGVGNISAYREISNTAPIPDIVLLVDNFGTMIKMYPDLDTFFIALTGSGANYGMYLVATANASSAVPTKINQNIKNAVALQMIDKSDYTYIVGKTTGTLPAIAGRGFAKMKPPLEFQTATPAYGDSEKEITDNIQAIATVMSRCWNGNLPEAIPEMPEVIPYRRGKSGILLGLSSEKVQPVTYQYENQHYIMISGTDQSGKSNMVQTIARQFYESLGGALYTFDIKAKKLQDIAGISEQYLTVASEIDLLINGLKAELNLRLTKLQSGASTEFQPIIFAIDDYGAFFQAVSNGTAELLSKIVKIGGGLCVYLIVAGDSYELTSMFNKGEALCQGMLKGKQTIMLGGTMNDHASITTKATYAQKGSELKEHEGYFVKKNEFIRFKAMKSGGEES